MTDPEGLVSGIFTAAVGIIVLVSFYGVTQGWDIRIISRIVSTYALPFIIALLVLFTILSIADMGAGR